MKEYTLFFGFCVMKRAWGHLHTRKFLTEYLQQGIRSWFLLLAGIWNVLSNEMVETGLRLNLAVYGKMVDVL